MVQKKRLKTVISNLVLIVLAIVMISSIADAWRLETWKIGSSSLSFRVHQDFGTDSWGHMSQAAQKWNAEAGRTLISVSAIRHTNVNYPAKDSNNYIYRLDKGLKADYVGQGTIYLSSDGRTVIEADININTYHDFANSAQPNKYDVFTLVLHEFGHVVGLNHIIIKVGETTYDTAVMWPAQEHNKEKRDLKPDDKAGLAERYK